MYIHIYTKIYKFNFNINSVFSVSVYIYVQVNKCKYSVQKTYICTFGINYVYATIKNFANQTRSFIGSKFVFVQQKIMHFNFVPKTVKQKTPLTVYI